MSRVAKIILGLLALPVLLLVGTAIYGASQPKEWHIEVTETIPAAPAAIFPVIAELKEWPSWTPWNKELDPTGVYTYSAPSNTVGAESKWDGEKMGKGRLKVTSLVPNERLEYDLWFDESDTPSHGKMMLAAKNGGTVMTWTDDGVAENVLFRLMIPMITEYVGADFAKGMATLKKQAEAGRFKAPAPATGAAMAVPATAAGQAVPSAAGAQGAPGQ